MRILLPSVSGFLLQGYWGALVDWPPFTRTELLCDFHDMDGIPVWFITRNLLADWSIAYRTSFYASRTVILQAFWATSGSKTTSTNETDLHDKYTWEYLPVLGGSADTHKDCDFCDVDGDLADIHHRR